MSVEQAGTVVRRYFEQINDRNVAVLDELLSPNYVDHTPLPFPVPAGRDGTSQVAHAALRATPDGWHRIRAQVADGDQKPKPAEAEARRSRPLWRSMEGCCPTTST